MAHKISERPCETYRDIIERDATGYPDYLRHAAMPDIGTAPVAAERYWSRRFFEQENRYLWPRVWQMACLVDEIPNTGDCVHYEIATRSLIIVNTGERIRAFFNACLHRGRKLITGDCRRGHFVCPFHAITWSLDGELVHNPIAWDLPQWSAENSRLPQARVATWGGFVFVCMDPDAPGFEEVAGPMIEHFAPYGWNERYCAWRYRKRIRANWKIAQETFMESHHSQTTHPQLLPSIADINSQYDFLNAYVSRHISAGATASPALDPMPDEHEKVRMMRKRGDRRVAGVDFSTLPDDFRARTYLGAHSRKALSAEFGQNLDGAKDAEVLDYLLYAVFPNMSFWAGYGPKLVYRWRPEPNDPECSSMDILWMQPLKKGQAKPPVPDPIVLDYDEKISGREAGAQSLQRVFDQDFSNIPHIQSGMKSLPSGEVHFTEYSEARIRFLHQFIDRFIDTGERGEPVPVPELSLDGR